LPFSLFFYSIFYFSHSNNFTFSNWITSILHFFYFFSAIIVGVGMFFDSEMPVQFVISLIGTSLLFPLLRVYFYFSLYSPNFCSIGNLIVFSSLESFIFFGYIAKFISIRV
jgi:hypothetical protein